jgi:hypothetical protein
MMVEDRGKDEFSAQNLMKKHDALDAAVDDYSNNVRQLGEAARQLIAEGHPDSEQIGVRLAQVMEKNDSLSRQKYEHCYSSHIYKFVHPNYIFIF